MKTKKFFLAALTMMCAMTTTVMTACSSSDDDGGKTSSNDPVAATMDYVLTTSNEMLDILDVTIEYYDENGKEAKSSGTNTFTTHADVVDTMLLVSDFKFPTCSYGLTEPQVTLQLRSVVSSRYTTVYSRTVWVDCFIFKPHEEEATEQRNIKITN